MRIVTLPPPLSDPGPVLVLWAGVAVAAVLALIALALDRFGMTARASAQVAGFLRRLDPPAPVVDPWPIRLPDFRMEVAIAVARETLPTFRRLVGEGNDAMVVVPVRLDSGVVEYHAAKVRGLQSDTLHVEMYGRPRNQRGHFDLVREVLLGEIAEWQVRLPNGRIKGGATVPVNTCRIIESGQKLSSEFWEILGRYDDIDGEKLRAFATAFEEGLVVRVVVPADPAFRSETMN